MQNEETKDLDRQAKDGNGNDSKEDGSKSRLKHINKIVLDDCSIPIGCPLGLDPAEDVIPDHHPCSDTHCDNHFDKFYCFAANTPVWVDGQLSPISKVAPGQSISFESQGGGVAVSLGEVMELIVHEGVFESRTLILENGEQIEVAGGHRFLNTDGGWVSSDNIQPGMRLQAVESTVEVAEVLEDGSRAPLSKVYNLKIEHGDRYLVGIAGLVARDH